MARLLRRTGLRYLQRHPWQFVLAVGGVALGVAVAVSVALATAVRHTCVRAHERGADRRHDASDRRGQ